MPILENKLKMLKNHSDYQALLKPNFRDSSTNTSPESIKTTNNQKHTGRKCKSLSPKTVPLEMKCEESNKT